LVLNISVHDQPIDESLEFYKALSNGPLKKYTQLGCEDRESSYFLRMFLGCVRAVDYLASRPDWDGKTLLVAGQSQGGLQAMVAAALSPKVTGVLALVPAGCDTHSPRVGRSSSWPYWLSNRENDLEKVKATAVYFDGINFAARIHCPVLIAYGLADETSRPSGVAAAVNLIRAPKEVLILPLSDHKGKNGSHTAFRQRSAVWKKAAMGSHSLPPPAP
jgi:cephalosporin-C deacetylase